MVKPHLPTEVLRLGFQLQQFRADNPNLLAADLESPLSTLTANCSPPLGTTSEYPDDWNNDDDALDTACDRFRQDAEPLLSIRSGGGELRRSNVKPFDSAGKGETPTGRSSPKTSSADTNNDDNRDDSDRSGGTQIRMAEQPSDQGNPGNTSLSMADIQRTSP